MEDDDRLRTQTAYPTLPNAAPYVERTRKWALIVVVLASFALAAWVASPFWFALLLGVLLAVSVHQPYEVLCRWLGQKRAPWAAGILTLASGLLTFVAGAVVLLIVASELSKLVANFNAHGNTGSLAGIIGVRAERAIANLGVDTEAVYAWAQRELGAAASFAASAVAIVVRETSFALLGLVMTLTTMFYVLLEGNDLARRIERMAPLEPRHTRALLMEAREVGRTAFLGTILTAIIQGAIGGVGYVVLGVPHPITWAVVTALASLLPVVGTLLVWAPIAGYFLLEGSPLRALAMLLWGVFFVTSLADYVIRPRIVGRHGHGHPLLTLVALLGGIEVFGLAGLIVAPIFMSVFVAAFRLYEREVRAGALTGSEPPSVRPVEGAPEAVGVGADTSGAAS